MEEYRGEKYYTAQEVCQMLNISMSTLRTWRLQGKLKGHQFSERVFLYSESEISQKRYGVSKPTILTENESKGNIRIIID